ncbi:cold shock domain-containing protein, partial [Bacteroides xylanisolvens]
VVGNIAENNIVTFDLERGVKGMNAVNISLENKSKPENLAQTESV